MKKLFVLSLAALGFVACEKRAEHIIVSGKITNYNGLPVQLIGGDVEQELKINTDGSFVDTLKQSNYYTIFSQAGVYIPLYLEQGDVLNLNIDLAQSPASVKLSGKDTIASAYLQKKLELSNELQKDFPNLFQKNVEDFKKSLAEVDKKYTDFLKNYKNLPKSFISLEEKAIKYFNLQFKSFYARAHERFTGEKVELPAEFKEEIAKVDFDNATDFDLFNEYKQLVTDNFYSKLDPSLPDWGAMVNYVRGLKSDNIKGYLSEFLVRGLSAANSSETNEAILSAIKEFSKKEDLKKEAETRFASFENLKPGKPSPTFDFENYAGGKTSLESLKGNLVYIDVWATWCVPCLNEIPALQALEKEFHGKNVKFVSISIDQEKQKWADYQKENKLTGLQLYADLNVENNFAAAYGIQTIPRFILIDKEGNIINADAPRPSDPSIKELLNKNL